MEAKEIFEAIDKNRIEREKLEEKLEKVTQCSRCSHFTVCRLMMEMMCTTPKLRSKRYPVCDYYEKRSE